MRLRSRHLPLRLLASALALGAALAASPVLADDARSATASASQDPPAGPSATTESQREAAAVLKAMAEYLAGLQSFTYTVQVGYDVVQPSGQKIEFGETRRVAVDRPGRLRIEKVASDGERDLIIFDGEHITVFDADAGVFAQAQQPGTLDDAIVYFVRDLQMRMPLARLLTTRLKDELPRRIKALDYVEETDLFGVPTDHIAGRTDSVDFQFWVTQGDRPLLQRVVLTYRTAAGQPQFWSNFSAWNTHPQLASTSFKFTPPKGAHQVAFAVQVQNQAANAQPALTSKEIEP